MEIPSKFKTLLGFVFGAPTITTRDHGQYAGREIGIERFSSLIARSGGGDVRHMYQCVFQSMAVEGLAAGQRIIVLGACRHPFAAFVHGVLLRRPVALPLMLGEVGLGASGQVALPGVLESGSCLLEARRIATAASAFMR